MCHLLLTTHKLVMMFCSHIERLTHFFLAAPCGVQHVVMRNSVESCIVRSAAALNLLTNRGHCLLYTLYDPSVLNIDENNSNCHDCETSGSQTYVLTVR